VVSVFETTDDRAETSVVLFHWMVYGQDFSKHYGVFSVIPACPESFFVSEGFPTALRLRE